MIISITVIFCGCNEIESSTVDTQKKLQFNSELVELIDSELIFHKVGDVIKRVEVKYLFRNLLNEKIDFKVYAEFYDEADNLLSREGPKEIILPPKYIEQGYGGANIIIYSGEMSRQVDHVILIVEQKSYE